MDVRDRRTRETRGLGRVDEFVVLLSRFLATLRPWVVVWTVLTLCAVAYAIAWSMKRR